MILRSLSLIAALVIAPAALAQDVEEVRDLQVVKLNYPGQPTACALRLYVVHKRKADGFEHAVLGTITAYVADGHLPGLLFKLVHISGSGALSAPAGAYLVNPDGATTGNEMIYTKPSDTGEFTMINFRYEAAGQRAMERLSNNGLATLWTKAADGAEEQWGIDFAGRNDALLSWVGCLSEIGFPILD